MTVVLERPAAASAAPGYRGLRAFLDLLDRDGDLARISEPVALDQELGAVCVHNLRAGGPALLFERPGNHHMPVLTNLLSTRRRYARAMECSLGEIPQRWNAAAANPLPPVLLEGDGPCQEVVQTGDDVDVLGLPTPKWNALDGGPYLTLSCHVTRDPRTGERNVGVYRNQVHDRRTLGVLAGTFSHLMLQRRHEPDAPFPVALVMGPDPRIVMAACTPLPLGVDELAMAGALRGEPIELVRCKTVPLEVPADAELVIEGEVRPAEKRDEGPFGEYTGHYAGRRAPRATIHVTAITRRRDAILSLAYQGAPPHETEVLTAVGKEAELVRTVSLPGIKSLYLTSAGCGALHLVVSVEKLYEGYGKMVGMAFLSTPASRTIKQVIVVDEDVDPFDALAVEWAVATRVQAHRNVEIFTEMPGTSIDPSLPESEQTRTARTSKMLIDATRYDAKNYPAVCLPSAEAMARVERNWASYGIPVGTPPPAPPAERSA
ncbi:MAG: UbiD family decarboxylase [Chloroflexi bacterium]|nr:UbiD family decarboxylase [Chloroflexota bacterium]